MLKLFAWMKKAQKVATEPQKEKLDLKQPIKIGSYSR